VLFVRDSLVYGTYFGLVLFHSLSRRAREKKQEKDENQESTVSSAEYITESTSPLVIQVLNTIDDCELHGNGDAYFKSHLV
jgi:hypothetical protein